MKNSKLFNFIEGRWFTLIDLILVLISAALWYGWPELKAWPLLLVLMPWGIRWITGYSPIPRTSLNVFLLIFLLTALMGVWVAYDRETALGKFWVILSAIFLFYALAHQPKENLWLITGAFGFLGFALSCFFLLSHDWGALPSKFEVINQAAKGWMNIRPIKFPSTIHPNGAAGIIAMMTPFVLALGLNAWRKRNTIGIVLVAVTAAIVLFALVLTSSRGAWIGLGIVFLAWFGWERVGVVVKRMQLNRSTLLALVLAFFIVLLFVVMVISPRLFDSFGSDSGYGSLGSRQDLARDTRFLIEDFPFTGAGLRSFPGLYSQYILVIPFFYIDYSHNIFLDVALEQGVLGATSLVIVYLVTAYLILRHLIKMSSMGQSSDLLAKAILAGLGVMAIHNLLSDVIYGNRGSPLIFLFPGLALGLIYQKNPRYSQERAMGDQKTLKGLPGQRSLGILIFGSFVLLFGSLFILRAPLLGTWYANWGAVELARAELAGWPMGKWADISEEIELGPAENSFQWGLNYWPDQRTAHHRLGLIAMRRLNFSLATSHLEQAYVHARDHHGIKKNLALSYVWLGEYDKAKVLVEDMPDVMNELSVYVWWWGTQGRSDLSVNAEQMLAMLNNPE